MQSIYQPLDTTHLYTTFPSYLTQEVELKIDLCAQ